MQNNYEVVIVGGGHAGAQAAIGLRQSGFTGTLAIINAEPELPYERPPLSKDYLAGDKTFERLLIRPDAFWRDHNVVMRLGTTVTLVDSQRHELGTDSGERISYRYLIWATGGAPRKLSCVGHHLNGVHTVRTREDADRMMSELPDVKRVVVIGGGYIGLEAAAVLEKFGKHVVLLEALDRVLARVAGETLSRFYETAHRQHGVEIRLGAMVECLEGDEWVTGVRLVDGEVLPAHMVIVGIGIIPAVGPLLEAGAEGTNGVLVDAQCRTSLPDIYAIGDCALHANAFAGDAKVRLESVQNANDQANVAVKSILGQAANYHSTPWFWSDQYNLKLQTIGISTGYDAAITRGDPSTGSFSVVYLKDGRVLALDCVNAIKDFVQGRKLVESSVTPDLVRLSDVSVPLKELL